MISVATRNDIKGIAQVESRCFTSPWTEAMLEESFDNGCIMIVVKDGESVVGYAGVYPSGDITNIAVLPEFRGRGYGTLLVSELIQQAKLQGIESLYLEVRVSNRVAIKLYEKCGFKKISVRKKYYKDGEDALIYAFGGV